MKGYSHGPVMTLAWTALALFAFVTDPGSLAAYIFLLAAQVWAAATWVASQ